MGLGYADPYIAATGVPSGTEFGPIALEGLEGKMIDTLARKGTAGVELMPHGGGVLLAEFGSNDAHEAEIRARRMMEGLRRGANTPNLRIYTQAEAKSVWHVREAGPRGAQFTPGAPLMWEGWEDAAVPPEKLGPYQDLRKTARRIPPQAGLLATSGTVASTPR